MFNFLPIASHSLRRLTVVLDDIELRRAALFPLFDREGEVRRVLLLDEESPELHILDLGKTPLGYRGWRRWEVEGYARRLSLEEARSLGDLWHFDPWWMLKERRYAGNDAAPRLLQTNACSQFCDRRKRREIKKLYYRRDLTRVLWAEYSKKGQSGLVAFSSCELPEAATEDASRVVVAGRERRWRLDPCWRRRESA